MLFGRAFEQAVGALFRREDPAAVLFEQWGVCKNMGLAYSGNDTWDRMLQQGIQLLERFARREVQRELTGREEEPSELIYFKVYKSQIPVIEQAIETAALMLGTDKSRGYCLEMICADFLAGAHLDNGNPGILLNSISRYYKFLPGEQRQAFLENLREKAS
jgi:hypothetical protein